jgi:hypothetical protein
MEKGKAVNEQSGADRRVPKKHLSSLDRKRRNADRRVKDLKKKMKDRKSVV